MDDAFFKIAEFLALVPCEFYKKHKQMQYLHITLIIAVNLTQVMQVCYYAVGWQIQEITLLMAFNAGVAALAGIFTFNTVLQNVLLQANTFDQMRQHCKAFDAMLPQEYQRYVKKYTKVYSLIFYVGPFFYEAYTEKWNNVGVLIFYYWTQVYFISMQSVIWNALSTVRYQVKNLNFFLETLTQNNVIIVQSSRHDSLNNNIHISMKLVLLNAKITEAFNEIFGFNIFVLVIDITLQLLFALKIFLIMSTNYMSLFILQCMYMLAQVVWMIKLSQEILNEGRMTTSLGYEVLSFATNEAEREIIQEFIKQTEVLCPVISAKGYFTLDYKLLFQMLQLIITFMVVLLQMK